MKLKTKGQTIYRMGGMLHRLDGPAFIAKDGTEYWYKNDKLHRIGGPAIIRNDKVEYWINYKRHRLDGPAVEYNNGFKEYWINGIQYNETEFINKKRSLTIKKLLDEAN